MVKQNIVFVENTPGSLQKVTKILAENQIDIYGRFAIVSSSSTSVWYATIRKEQMRSWLSMDT